MVEPWQNEDHYSYFIANRLPALSVNDIHIYKRIFFNLQKAFDSVLHHALLDKLGDLQLNEFILKWICDYLTESGSQQTDI